jgi:D-alanyl-D-alanine carboxypeptidase
MASDPLARIAEINRQLGIPSAYAMQRGLHPQPEASESELIVIGTTTEGRPVRLAPPAAHAWRALHAAAAADGITLMPVSGFRSIARQEEIIREKLAAGRSLADILRYVMAPGYSEHHTGCSIDITAPDDPPLEEGFARTTAFAWLQQNAARHGFTLSYPKDNPRGIGYEPWHWFWAPRLDRR